MEGEDRVLATAQQIMKSLHTSADTDDMLLIFSRFDNRLSNLSNFMSSSSATSTPSSAKAAGAAQADGFAFDSRFEEAEKLIADGTACLSSDSDVFLSAVDEIIRMTEDLEISRPRDEAAMDRVDAALQLAMSQLEDEFRNILARGTVPLDTERLHHSSFIRRSSLSPSVSEFPDFETGTVSEGGDRGVVGSSGRYNHLRGPSLGGLEMNLDLINPDFVDELKEIADRMIRSGYEKECCQVYSTVRRDVLDEFMSVLGVEKVSIEEVQKMEGRSLDEKMKKWTYTVKIVVRVILSGEKQLCEHFFSGSDLTKEICFIETAKGCVMQILNFGEAVVIGKKSSEKLFRILDMYDALSAVMPDLEDLFSHEAGEMVCSEAKGVLDGLGEAAIGTFVEFENAVQGEASKTPIQGGEIHPLTRYVMNYLIYLVDYSNTINELLSNVESGLESESSQVDDDRELESNSLFAKRLSILIKSLEANIEEKSRVYEDIGMQYVFLMNNMLYIVQKVKDSDLRKHMGDLWVRKRRGQVRQYATAYLRASWSKVLSCLKDEGIGASSNNASKVALKERFKNFNACFEELYRIQTAWKVPDEQLREELRISISEKVIPAYRSFLGRFGSHLESGRNSGKYIKYTADDLENYLLDLFEGNPLSLHNTRRKSS
ncbi:unnamed protein product [Cuscuta campestris]|uniref:Exocyst subunit Exo70 family protein n=1 Tax=Cuscuta campestris TaxID=132261 RepID=A0A484MR72_9ASTE|nr:unnamed protein product [Cuscuta campestris]